jgi:capping protein beta
MNATNAEALPDSWDSIHVFEVSERGRQAHYKLTSTVMLQLVTRRSTDPEMEAAGVSSAGPGDKRGERWKRNGEIVLSGNMTRQVRGFPTGFVDRGHNVDHLLWNQTEQDWPLHDASSHITNTGRMVEEMEIKMRNLLQEVGVSIDAR